MHTTQPLHVNDQTIDLVHYLIFPLRHWWILTIFAFVGASGGYLFGDAQKPVYFSTTRLLLRDDVGLQKSRLYAGGSPMTMAETYVELIVVEPSLEIVNAQLGRKYDTYQLRGMINAEQEGPFIRISATAPNPDDAAVMVNVLAQEFVDSNERTNFEYFDNVLRQLTVKDPQYLDRLFMIQSGVIGSVRIIEPALPIGSPISPKPKRLAAVGGFLAILVGTLVSIVIYATRDRIEQWNEVLSKKEITLLGRIPRLGKKDMYSRPATPNSAQNVKGTECFRQLIIAIRYAMDKQGCKTLLITSDINQRGKSTIVANLGTAGVASGMKITVIEADVYHPRLADLLEHPMSRFGFSDFLVDRGLTFNDVTSSVRVGDSSCLQVVFSGQSSEKSAVLIENSRLEEILKKSAEVSDLVLIDCPPIMSVAHTRVMAAYADAMALVVDERKTKVSQLRNTLRLIRLTGVYVAGMIINESVKDGITYSDDSYRGYGDSVMANNPSSIVIKAAGKIRQLVRPV